MIKSTALLAAEAAIDEACRHAIVDTATIRAKCRALLVGYDKRWHGADYQPLEVEKLYIAPLVNPETNKPSRTFRLAGIIDILAEYHEKRVLMDHKTTSQDIADPDSPYWRQLVVEGQNSHYSLLLWLNGLKVDDSVWDVVKKPGISPKKLAKADIKAVLATQEYCGVKLSVPSVLDVTANERETLEMYEARLVKDCTVDRPEHYFQRRSVPRLDSELLEYSRELWEHADEIRHARATNHHARNSGACMLFGSPCKFLGICSGYDNPDSDKWTRKEHVHNELPQLPGDGRDLLTNSRIRCFQTCRRKEYYEYEMGIERLDEEEREALLFGTIWHEGLAAWFNSFLKGSDNGNGNDTPPGIGLDRNAAASQEAVSW